jgi:hypothetical protein
MKNTLYILCISLLSLTMLACQPEDREPTLAEITKTTPIPGATRLDVETTNGCPTCTQFIFTELTDVKFEPEKKLLSFNLVEELEVRDCNGGPCVDALKYVPQRVCFSVSGTQVTPATGCAPYSSPLPAITVDLLSLRGGSLEPTTAETKRATSIDAFSAIHTLELKQQNQVLAALEPIALVKYNEDFSLASPPLLLPPSSFHLTRSQFTQAGTGTLFTTPDDTVYTLRADGEKLLRKRVRGVSEKGITAGAWTEGNEVVSLLHQKGWTKVSATKAFATREVYLSRKPKMEGPEEDVYGFVPVLGLVSTWGNATVCYSRSLDVSTLKPESFRLTLGGTEVKVSRVTAADHQCVIFSFDDIGDGALQVSAPGLKSLLGETMSHSYSMRSVPEFSLQSNLNSAYLPSGMIGTDGRIFSGREIRASNFRHQAKGPNENAIGFPWVGTLFTGFVDGFGQVLYTETNGAGNHLVLGRGQAFEIDRTSLPERTARAHYGLGDGSVVFSKLSGGQFIVKHGGVGIEMVPSELAVIRGIVGSPDYIAKNNTTQETFRVNRQTQMKTLIPKVGGFDVKSILEHSGKTWVKNEINEVYNLSAPQSKVATCGEGPLAPWDNDSFYDLNICFVTRGVEQRSSAIIDGKLVRLGATAYSGGSFPMRASLITSTLRNR